MRERMQRDKVPFETWVKKGYIHATPGDVVDYEAVKTRILELSEVYQVKVLGTDPWNSQMLTQELVKNGVDCVEITQNMKNMSPAMKFIERFLRKGWMTHENHPAARWCFGNVRVVSDGNENIKPMKNKSVDRIDIMVAWINGIAAALADMDMGLDEYVLSGEWSM